MTSWPAKGGKRDKASDELFARTDRIQSASRGGYPEAKAALAELGPAGAPPVRSDRIRVNPTDKPDTKRKNRPAAGMLL
jgi:hypothetical protein